MEIDKSIKDIVDQISKKFGPGSAFLLSDDVVPCNVRNWVSTGVVGVDHAIHRPGIPVGRITEIFGKESSGKSTLAMSILAETQKVGGVAVLIDTENAYDPIWAKKNGVQNESLITLQPGTLEEVFERIRFIAEYVKEKGTEKIVTIVLDSLAATPTQAEVEAGDSSSVIAAQARVLSPALRKVAKVIQELNVALIIVNQLRESVGIMFGSTDHSPGGRALRHHAVLRLKVDFKKRVQEQGKVVGVESVVRVVKNKVAAPFGEATLRISFERGILKRESVVETGKRLGLLEARGGWYYFGDGNKGYRLNEIPDEVLNGIESQIREVIK